MNLLDVGASVLQDGHMTAINNTTPGVEPPLTLGWRMQMALGHAGLDIQQIAEELGVARSTVSRWMHDKGPVRPVFVKAWAMRCGVSYDWLRGADSDGATSSYADILGHAA